MASEKVTNLAETTLASSYTAGAASISVTSAALFPTTGMFSVRVDNPSETILRVSAVSGTTLTVTAEANDGNADAGTTVILIISEAVLERFLQSPESGEQRAPSGVAGGDFFGPLGKMTELDQSSWTSVNATGATMTQANGIFYFLGATAVGSNIALRVKSHAASKIYTALVQPDMIQAGAISNLGAVGIGFRESGTGELSLLLVANFNSANGNPPAEIAVSHYNSPTSHNSNVVILLMPMWPFRVWLRIEDNNTNLIYSYSLDGVNYRQIASHSRTSFMAGGPDQVGVFASAQSSSVSQGGSFLSWVET